MKLPEQRRADSVKALAAAGISYTEHNNGYHFRIGRMDFFPTTGRWLDLDNDKRGLGVNDLIEYIKGIKKAQFTVHAHCPCCKKILAIIVKEAA